MDGRRETGDGGVVFGDFLAHYYRRRPVNATYTGKHDYDHLLPDWSAAGVEQLRGEMEALRARIAAVAAPIDEAIAALDFGAIDLALADSFLEIQLAELDGRQFQRGNPSLVIGEALFAVISLMVRDFAPQETRARMLRARLAALPRFLASALAVVAESPVPSTWIDKALRECEGGRLLLGAGPRSLVRTAAMLPDELRDAIRREGDAALGAVEAFAAELSGIAARRFARARVRSRDARAADTSRPLVHDADRYAPRDGARRVRLPSGRDSTRWRARSTRRGSRRSRNVSRRHTRRARSISTPSSRRGMPVTRSRMRTISCRGPMRRSAMCRSPRPRAMRRLTSTICSIARPHRSSGPTCTSMW